MATDSLSIIYRSMSHAPLWIVAEKSGAWEKNHLVIDSSPQLVREKAVEALLNRHVDLISGNHHNLYVRNAKDGADFVHLAQATTGRKTIWCWPCVGSLEELRGQESRRR